MRIVHLPAWVKAADVGDVLPYRQPAQQVVVLGHHTQARTGGVVQLDGRATQHMAGAAAGHAQTRQHIQQAAFARAVAAHQADHGAWGDGQRDIVQRPCSTVVQAQRAGLDGHVVVAACVVEHAVLPSVVVFTLAWLGLRLFAG